MDGDRKHWDATFERWISEAETAGEDPNDIGDREWHGSAEDGARKHYLPHITSRSVVLELGPGTGRYTRHIIGVCRRMILVDYSSIVCEWLEKYLEGRGEYELHHISGPQMPQVNDETVDFAFAHGVFEHLFLDDIFWFFEEFYRVLRPGALFKFNFDNLMSDGGMAHLRRTQGAPGERNIFRFYHPESLCNLARQTGFQDSKLTVDETRFAFLELSKPPLALSRPAAAGR